MSVTPSHAVSTNHKVLLQPLICGCNATGLSLLISLKKLHDNNTSVYLHGILVNIGDLTQRYCIGNKIKILCIKTVFICSLAPHNLSGLPGLVHTLSQLGSDNLTLIGPPGLKIYVDLMTPFVNKRYPEINVFEVHEQHSISKPFTFENNFIMIQSIPIRSTEGIILGIGGVIHIKSNLTSIDPSISNTSYNSVIIVPYSDSHSLSPTPCEVLESFTTSRSRMNVFIPLSVTDNVSTSYSSVVESIKIDKSILSSALIFDLLLDMEQVELLHVQKDIEYFNNLYPNLFCKPFRSRKGLNPPGTDKSNTTTNSNCRDMNSDDSEDIQVYGGIDLSCLIESKNCEGFILSKYPAIRSKYRNLFKNFERIQQTDQTSNIIASMLIDNESAVSKNDQSQRKSITSFDIDQNTLSAQSIRERILSKGKRKRSSFNEVGRVEDDTMLVKLSENGPSKASEFDQESVFDSFQVLFLGTGSASPSKHRNNSGIVLTIPIAKTSISKYHHQRENLSEVYYESEQVSILLDTGEGVACQLFYNCEGDRDKFIEMLLSIRVIWVSHHHCDHIAGFPCLLEQIYRSQIIYQRQYRSKCNNSSIVLRFPKIHVICPNDIVKNYFEYTAIVSGMDHLIEFLPIQNTLYAGITSMMQQCSHGTISKLQSVPVYHCPSAYGVILFIDIGIEDRKKSFKIVYSGDCRPSKDLIVNGRDCDLLIHEATFDDRMIDDAMKKKHCTIQEAIDVSRRMNAKHLITTHFSQRYPITGLSNDNNNKAISIGKCIDSSLHQVNDVMCITENMNRIGFAFDLLRFKYPVDMDNVIIGTQFLNQGNIRMNEES